MYFILTFNSIFDGKYGSTEENALESELDELEEKQNFILEAHFRWSQAELLVDCGHKQLSEAVNQWKLVPSYQDSSDRYILYCNSGHPTSIKILSDMESLC